MSDGVTQSRLAVLLFTDVVGSTDLKSKIGTSAYTRLLSRHNDLFESLCKRFDGGEILKHTGDGFMASFADASSAIHAAVAIQKSLTAQNQGMPDNPIQVRIGMNAGEPVDEGSDLFGAAVQLARRVCDAADAERIFVSAWHEPKGDTQKIKEQNLANPLWVQLKGQKQDVSDVVWVSSV